MNRERAAKLLPIIKAFAEGEDIQWRHKSHKDKWLLVNNIPLSIEEYEYRVKPKLLELWVNVYRRSPNEYFPYCDREKAENFKDRFRTIHMREVE